MRLRFRLVRLAAVVFAIAALTGCYTVPRQYTGSEVIDLGGPPRDPNYLQAAIDVGRTLEFGVGGRTPNSVTLQRQSSAVMNYFTSAHEHTQVQVSFSEDGRKITLMIMMFGGLGPNADTEANGILSRMKSGLRSRLEPPPQPAPVAAPPPEPPKAPQRQRQRKAPQ